MPALPIEITLGQEREWTIPFSPEEYRERFKRVRAEMSRCGVETLYVTSPPNLTYLTGYDCRWYRRTTPTGLAINLKDDVAIFFDDISHRGLVIAGTGLIEHAAFFSRYGDTQREGWIYRNTADDVVDTIAARGWLKGTVALEHWALAPGGISLRHIEARMKEKGARIAGDGSWIVDRVRLIKSPRELQLIEEASAIADAGISAIAKEFRPGMTEIQVQGIAHYAMSKLNGEEPAIRTSTASGPKTIAHHNLPTRRKIMHGDLIVLDLSGSVHRYHGNLARTFSVGEPDKRWTSVLDKAAVSIQKVVEAVRPGDSTERIVEVAREYLDSVDLAKYGWFIGGYDLGIAVPPDWVGHTYLHGHSFDRVNMDVGMVVNYENVFDITDGWPGGYCVMYIDTLVMTAKGLRIMSRLDRNIIVLGD